MGARPLKRAIDQYVVAPLAAMIVEKRFPEGDQFLFVRSDGEGIQVEFVDPDADATDKLIAPVAEPITHSALAAAILAPQGTPDEFQMLEAECAAVEQRLSTLRVERSQRRTDRRDVLGRFLESPRPLRGACSLRTDGSREGRSRDGACVARSGPALQPVAAPLFGGAQRPLRAAALSHQGRDQGRFRRCSGRGCADHRAGSRRRRRPTGDAVVVQRSDCRSAACRSATCRR